MEGSLFPRTHHRSAAALQPLCTGQITGRVGWLTLSISLELHHQSCGFGFKNRCMPAAAALPGRPAIGRRDGVARGGWGLSGGGENGRIPVLPGVPAVGITAAGTLEEPFLKPEGQSSIALSAFKHDLQFCNGCADLALRSDAGLFLPGWCHPQLRSASLRGVGERRFPSCRRPRGPGGRSTPPLWLRWTGPEGPDPAG